MDVAYRFSGFSVDPVRRLLFGPDGRPIALKPRVFDTLLYLVERRGELLDKQALLDAVWPGVVVEENNLNQAISTLRRVFGETRGENSFIVTEPGRGYRFVAEVETVARGGAASAPALANVPSGSPTEALAVIDGRAPHKSAKRRSFWLRPAAGVAAVVLAGLALLWLLRPSYSPPPEAVPRETVVEAATAPDRLPNSIAVLPFENLSPDPADSYFASGIHEEILNQLTKLRQMTVIARTTMRQYEGTTKAVPEIARELNVQNVMEGSIRYADGRVRITTQLIDALSGATLWSETYEREFNDIFAIESDIALRVAAAMRTELSATEAADIGAPPTTSAEAYSLYLSAKADAERSTAQGDLLAIDKIDRALELDPGFAEAWLGKAGLHARFQVFFPGRAAEGMAIANEALTRAEEVAPGLLAVQIARAAKLAGEGRWREAARAYRNIEDRQGYFGGDYGFFRLAVGFPQDAVAGLEVERLRSPLYQDPPAFMVAALNSLGDTAAALALYERTEQLLNDWTIGRVQAINTLLGMGETERAARILALGVADPAETPMRELLTTPQRAAERLRALRDDPRYGSNRSQLLILIWAAYFDEHEFVLEAARARIKAVPTTTYVLWTPVFADVRRHPGFKTLVTDVGLVDYWREYGWPQYCQPVVGTEDFTCR